LKKFCNTVKGLTEKQEIEFAKDSQDFAKKEAEKFRKQNKKSQEDQEE